MVYFQFFEKNSFEVYLEFVEGSENMNNKTEPMNQLGFNQPISFNFMQSIPKTAIQTQKPKNVETGNVFGFDSSSNFI